VWNGNSTRFPRDGTAVANGFRKMLAPSGPKKESAELRKALLNYCYQETLAMVEIYHALRTPAF